MRRRRASRGRGQVPASGGVSDVGAGGERRHGGLRVARARPRAGRRRELDGLAARGAAPRASGRHPRAATRSARRSGRRAAAPPRRPIGVPRRQLDAGAPVDVLTRLERLANALEQPGPARAHGGVRLDGRDRAGGPRRAPGRARASRGCRRTGQAERGYGASSQGSHPSSPGGADPFIRPRQKDASTPTLGIVRGPMAEWVHCVVLRGRAGLLRRAAQPERCHLLAERHVLHLGDERDVPVPARGPALLEAHVDPEERPDRGGRCTGGRARCRRGSSRGLPYMKTNRAPGTPSQAQIVREDGVQDVGAVVVAGDGGLRVAPASA